MAKYIVGLLVLIALLQYRLWVGDGGLAEINRLQTRIVELQQETEQRRERNAAVEAEVRDLREGTDAIEERARAELGMVKDGEVYYQVFESTGSATPPPRAPSHHSR